MEASGTMPIYDVTAVHAALSAASDAYHQMFAGHVPAEVHRFDSHLDTVKMVVDQSADLATKGE